MNFYLVSSLSEESYDNTTGRNVPSSLLPVSARMCSYQSLSVGARLSQAIWQVWLWQESSPCLRKTTLCSQIPKGHSRRQWQQLKKTKPTLMNHTHHWRKKKKEQEHDFVSKHCWDANKNPMVPRWSSCLSKVRWGVEGKKEKKNCFGHQPPI